MPEATKSWLSRAERCKDAPLSGSVGLNSTAQGQLGEHVVCLPDMIPYVPGNSSTVEILALCNDPRLLCLASPDECKNQQRGAPDRPEPQGTFV